MHETASSRDYIESPLQALAGRGVVMFGAEEGLRGAWDTPGAQPAAGHNPGGEEVSQGPHQPPSGYSSGTLCHQPWIRTKP